MKRNKQILRLLKMNRSCMWMIYLESLISILSALAGVAVALLTKNVVDYAIAKDTILFREYALYLAAMGLFQIALAFVSKLLVTSLVTNIDLNTKNILYSEILRRDYSAVGKYHSGTLMSRINDDVREVASGLADILPGILGTAARLIAAFVVVTMIDYRFALTFLGLGVVAMVAARFLKKKMEAMHRDVKESTEQASAFMQESMENLLMIKAFGAEAMMQDKESVLQSRRKKTIYKRRDYSAAANLFMNIAFYGGYILGMVWCAAQIAAGAISVGSFSAMIQLISQVERPLTSIAGYIPQIADVSASSSRICAILDMPGESDNKRDPAPIYRDMEALRLRDVTFAYDRENVLEHAEFTLAKGEFAVLCGQSGIGKSTLMKLLLGVYSAGDGEVAACGAFGTIPLDSTTRRLFAYVPQGNFLLSGTLRENITLMRPDALEEDIRRALEISDALGFVDQLPEGLDTVIGERGVGLSEGQIQRIAIARAILLDAPILLLDECTSALDEDTERRVLTNIRERTDKTCLLISHKKAALSVCDCAYILVDGTIQKQGTALRP